MICLSMLNTHRWHTWSCICTCILHANVHKQLNKDRNWKTKQKNIHTMCTLAVHQDSQWSPLSPVCPETWASPLFFPSALIPYWLSAAGTKVVFIFTHTHIARISLCLSDGFHLQCITNEWVYKWFLPHTNINKAWWHWCWAISMTTTKKQDHGGITWPSCCILRCLQLSPVL